MFSNNLFISNINVTIYDNIPNMTQACSMLGGRFINDLCLYDNLLTCISYNHRSRIDYKSNCTFLDYFGGLCLPKQKVIDLWCPQYPHCNNNSDCILTKNCVTEYNLNRCLFTNKQPYCVRVKDEYAILECD